MELIVLKLGVHNDIYPKKPEENVDHYINPICGAAVLIKGEKNIIVDTGNIGFKDEILKELLKHGLKADEIDYVINTHTHFDHCSNNYLFTKAKRICGINVWGEKDAINYKDPEKIAVSGVKIITTPGHRPEHTSVVAEVDGKTYVVAGDAIEEKNILEKKYESRVTRKEIYDSIKKILKIADVIIPGHGPIIEGKRLEQLRKAAQED